LSSGSSTIAKVLKTNQDTKEISMVFLNQMTDTTGQEIDDTHEKILFFPLEREKGVSQRRLYYNDLYFTENNEKCT
jgi:hypothetical protein